MPTALRHLRSAIAALAVAALALVGLTSTATADQHVLNASDLEARVYDADFQVGQFIVNATGDTTVEVDANNNTGGGMQFTQRLKMGGAGDAESRSVQFTTTGEAVLSVYVMSSSSSADRDLALYTLDGTEVARVPALGAPSGGDIPVGTLVVPDAGTYYIASPSSGVNIYYVELTEGPAPERPAWDAVAVPTITDVTVDGGDIVVSYDGVIGFEGADLATATLYDGETEVASGVSGTPGDAGSITLTPDASGDYEVQVALTRNDQETALLSERVAAPSFTLPLATPEITSALTSAVEGDQATVTVEWGAVPEAETYDLAYRETGATDWTAGPSTAGTSADITGLTPGTSYELQVTALRGVDTATSEPYAVTVSGEVERWLSAHAGISSNGELIENADGSLTFSLLDNNGKIADSEDGFMYYYTEIDPATENFTLSATFTVNDASLKDNQSGFGIVAVDTFEPNNRAARYFNNAGVMSAKYTRDVDGSLEVAYGTPGGKFVDGYTDAPTVASADRDMSRSQPFDWDFRAGYTEGSNTNPPRFTEGDVYEYTLRKSNTGFHAIWTDQDGEVHEIIDYEPDLLLQQDPDKYYVGIFAARKIVVTASDIEFTTIHPDDDEAPLPRPITYVDPTLSADVTRTTPHDSLDVPLVSNVHGEAVVRDGDGDVVGEVTLAPGESREITVPLEDGTNELTAELTPAPKEEQTQLGEYEDLSSYDPVSIPITIEVDRFGEPGESIHVAPDGTANGDGTPENPLDLHTAVAFVQPGQQIVLAPGTYRPTEAVVVGRGNDGTAEAPITLMSHPDGRATLDLSDSTSGGIKLRGDYWHLYDLEITGSQGYQKPLLIQGDHNVVERIESHHNQDTGVQISGEASEPYEMWPSDNLVVSSVSHNNVDPQGNDADGFAAKLTVGDGNVFRYNIAHHNIDDGWDLYAKSTTGPIGDVVVEDSVAYRNGQLEDDPERTGEGNGFKLGGESMPGKHLLRNSVSFGNLGRGVTSNSGPDVRVHDVTSYDNASGNLQLATSASTTDYEVSGMLSYVAGAADRIDLREQEDTLTTEPSNYLTVAGDFVRDASVNSEGDLVSDDWFGSLDTDLVPEIAADGSIEMHGLLELSDQAPAETGARLGANPEPTVITLLPPVGTAGGDEDRPGNRPPHVGEPGRPPFAGEQGPPEHARNR
ncbi:fibronectin type III domain-containing protein [Georgenia muralis]|uniref:Fibronectin type III domain protein n=1 Tax=Georgenia muralis TaxID=154117 RepID=A0A3N4Z1A3_9MICO|nr:fibronectin type III domain-containing protein [Georgenia muralis]RPF27069.1 fibronectin type III domain protein [Georgenia muralis]